MLYNVTNMRSLYHNSRRLTRLQSVASSLMAVLVLVTFVGANLHALLWQSSQWLVGAVLPAVVVDLTNKERNLDGVSALKRNSVLDEAARMKAEHMAKNQYFAHFSPDGVSPWHWFREAGYVYAHAGENLAIHFTDSAEVVKAWMESPAHRQNIVDGKFVEIGVGTAKGEFEGYQTVYVVQLFGAPGVAVDQAPIAKPTETFIPMTGQSEPTAENNFATETVTPATTANKMAELETVNNKTVLAESSRHLEELTTTNQLTEIINVDPEPEFEDISQGSDTAVTNMAVEAGANEGETAPDDLKEAFAVLFESNQQLVFQSPTIATTSGLAVAELVFSPVAVAHAGGTLSTMVTQPKLWLQIVYSVLGTMVVVMLILSILLAYRRLEFVQVFYGVTLLVVMSCLWFVHDWLTSGAVIV